MNTTKRLLSVLMCIAMLLSSLSSFGFALGNDTLAGATDAVETVVGDGTFAPGPNPTTNVAAPVITPDTIVYDGSVTDETAATYALTFTNKSTGEALDTSAWMAIPGENLFYGSGNLADAIIAATKEGGSGTILIKGNFNNIIPSGRKDAITNVGATVKIYSEYFNVMPYNIAGTAKDGSDWTLNEDFAANAPAFTWGDIAGGLDITFYGITLNNYLNTEISKTGHNLKLTVYNCYMKGAAFVDYRNCWNQNTEDATLEGSSITMKNVWFSPFSSTASCGYFYEYCYPSITFDGCYMKDISRQANNGWVKLGRGSTPNTNFNILNSALINFNQNWILQICDSYKFNNNAIVNSTLGNCGATSTSDINAIFGRFYTFKDLEIKNNLIIDTESNATFFAGYSSGSAGCTPNITITGNALIGVSSVINPGSMGTTPSASSIVDNNFCVPTYTEDYETATGAIISIDRAGGISSINSNFDYAGTVKTNAFNINSVDSNGKGSIVFDNFSKSITWLKTGGSAADLTINGSEGVTYTWHTAKDAAAVDASTITADGTYYIKASKGDFAVFYTVVVSVPENMFTDVFVEKDGITKAAILVDSDSSSTATGSIYEGSWKGTNYNFIKGINVFDKLSDAFVMAKTLENPQILVKKTADTHVNVSFPARLYTENYDINPVVKGDVWSLNPNFVYGAGCATSNVFDGLSVTSDAPAGDYYFYGFSVDYDIANKSFAAANMYVINTYLKLGAAGAFGGPGGQSAAVIENSKNMNSKLEFKNGYVTYNSTSTCPRLLTTGSMPTEFIIDGAFFDVPVDAATGREFYPNNYSDRAVIAIKNSYFKNTRWGGSAVFEGDKAAMSAEQDRKFIIDNNVFDNAYLGGDAIVRTLGQSFSGFTFTNNVIKNMDKDIVIFNNVGSNSENKAMDLVIENNKIYGGSGKVAKTTGRTLSDASSIAKNYYVANEDAVCGANVFADESLYGSSFYIDEEMTTLSTDLLLESVTENSEDELTSVVLDNNILLITLTTPEDTSVLDVVPQEGTVLTWYEDAALEKETEITDAPWTPDEFEEGSYLYAKVALEDDEDMFIVYRLAVVSPSENLFKDVYGEQGEDTVNIDKDKAIIITNDEALVNASNNQIVALTWKGIEYDFIKGKNAFTSYAAYVASEEFGKIDTPHILYKQAVDMVKNEYKLHLQAPAHVFTQNWDANPVKKGVALDGSDWAFNEGTEKGQWNSAYVVELSSFGVYNADAPAGEYWFYGFTTRYHLEDHAKAAVDTKFINIHFLSKNWSALGADGHSTGGNILLSFANKGNTAAEGEEPANAYQKVELKNIYVSLANGDVHPGLLFPGVMHEETILDSWFIDIPETNTTYKSSTSTSFVGNKGSLVIKDSLFRNMLYNQLAFVGDDVVAGDDKTITVENNIFINSQFRTNYSGLICFKPNAFTGLTIKDNYISKATGTEYASSTGAGNVVEGAPFKLVITGNYINEKENYWNAFKDRNYTEDSVIEGNFALYDGNTYGSYTYINGDVKDENNHNTIYMYTNWWYLDAAMTARSDEIQPGYTFNDAAFATEMAYEVGMKDTTVNLMDLIDTKGNHIKAYADDTCETPIDIKKVNVPAGGTKVYLKVESADGILVGAYASTATAASEVDENVYAVSLTRTAGNYLNNIAGGSRLDAPNYTDRYWVTWRGEYTVTGAGAEAIDASKHRVGAIYYSDIVVVDTVAGTTNLDAIKAAITAAVTAEGATVASIDTAVADINAARNSTIDRVYVLADTETLTWNNETQTYGFYYNFNIPQNYYRGVILYSVYADDAGAVQVEFSNAVIQQAK